MQARTQSFTTTFTGISRVLYNKVHVTKAFDPTTITQPLSSQTLGAKEYTAIWDTGATGSVITQKAADECGLKPIGVRKVNTASGENLTSVYFASIILPNRVVIPQIEVTRGHIAGNAEVLIGMDIICQGDFAVSNTDGKTVFTFRIPSLERKDFVKEQSEKKPLPPRTVRKVGRNQPCPCGSGKKYKNCCGR